MFRIINENLHIQLRRPADRYQRSADNLCFQIHLNSLIRMMKMMILLKLLLLIAMALNLTMLMTMNC